MKHSKRRKLKVAGSSLSTQLNPTQLNSDINSALIAKNVSPLFGYSSTFSPDFKVSNVANTASNTASNAQQSTIVHYIDDAEIDLEELVNKALPPVPLEVTFTAHWLAVEGVQPRTVQNPTPSTGDKTQQVLQGLPNLPTATSEAPLVKQVLTTQLQTYYEKVTSGVLSGNDSLKQIALESLEQDPGIQALLPYFVVFISEQITNNLKETGIASAMISIVSALIKNPHLFLDPYLHQIIPAVITCVVAKHLAPGSDHWLLRRQASHLLQSISKQCSPSYPGLQARITKTLVRSFLDTTKPAQTIYGSLYALWQLGPEVVDLLILPSVPSLYLRTTQAPETQDLVLLILRDHYARVGEGEGEEKREAWRAAYGGFAEAVFEDVVME